MAGHRLHGKAVSTERRRGAAIALSLDLSPPYPLRIFALPHACVSLPPCVLLVEAVAVYDVLGREVTVLHRGPLGAGEHRLAVRPSLLPAGSYVVRAQTEAGTVLARTLTVLR